MTAGRSTPAWLWAVGAIFVAGIGTIVVASLNRPEPPVYVLSTLEARPEPMGEIGPDTVTLDARSGEGWTLFDLERRIVTRDPATWDIGVRRHRLIVNGGDGFSGRGSAAALALPYDSVVRAPSEGYAGSRVTPGGDSVSAVLDDWYRYDFFSHLLQPEPDRTFVIRTAEGRPAKLRVLSYYCPGPEPGCMTMEYSLW